MRSDCRHPTDNLYLSRAEEAPAARDNPEEPEEQNGDDDGSGGSCILAAEIGVGLAARHPENMRAFLNLAGATPP